jgi:hypothetical protein
VKASHREREIVHFGEKNSKYAIRTKEVGKCAEEEKNQ